LQVYSRPTMLILYTPKRYIKLEDRDWRSQKKAVLLKNWSLHFFAQFCLGVLSKFVLDPFSFGIEPFSQRVYFILILVIDLKKKERESRWKIIKKKCYRLDKILAIKKIVFNVNVFFHKMSFNLDVIRLLSCLHYSWSF
jgi:hypothetical protein